MYSLYIANKNYSSWSLRPWVLMRALDIPFEEHMTYFTTDGKSDHFRTFSPTGKVPCLKFGKQTVWDSLGIVEFLAERHNGVWPTNSPARTWARCVSAEVHSGFTHLRSLCNMNCGLRVKIANWPPELMQDIRRIDALWQEGLREFGGPYLAGSHFTAVDAFFAPIVFRIQTYNLPLSDVAKSYASLMLEQDSMQQWYREALQETVYIQPYEIQSKILGEMVGDERVVGVRLAD